MRSSFIIVDVDVVAESTAVLDEVRRLPNFRMRLSIVAKFLPFGFAVRRRISASGDARRVYLCLCRAVIIFRNDTDYGAIRNSVYSSVNSICLEYNSIYFSYDGIRLHR